LLVACDCPKIPQEDDMRSTRRPIALLLGTALVSLIVALWAERASTQAPTEAAVLQYHKNPTRDGHYVEPAFTQAAAARLHLDSTFSAALNGPTFAQPLYWVATSASDRDMIIAATEQNEVSAFDPGTGAVIWHTTIGTPVPLSQMPCGNINPLGITGTPIIDPASRTLFAAAMVMSGDAKTHIVTALSIDDGSTRPGWPIDISTVTTGALTFEPLVQGQRGALALLGNSVYVPYGGHFGDCGDYHGWVVGIPITGPGAPAGWATRAVRGGIWGVGGIASDGVSLYVATGNTSQTKTWSDGEATIRLEAEPVFSGRRVDFFAPLNWRSLDARDLDVRGSGVLLVHALGATPSQLVVALGKDGNAYLVDQQNMGGIGRFVARQSVSSAPIINGPASYSTAKGTYVVFRGAGVGCPGRNPGDLVAIKIAATAPPSISVAWCATANGSGSPIVTTTDDQSNAIVWTVGADGDNRLHGFDGDTGQVIFDGGGPANAMTRVRKFQTPIVAKRRIYVAADTALFAFTTTP
jgi:outer membrane protein assembly factor BamB